MIVSIKPTVGRMLRSPGPARASGPRASSMAIRCFTEAPAKSQNGSKAAAAVPVSFTLQHKVHFGQNVVLVGSTEQLGAWDVTSALPMRWTDGNYWTASVELPAGATVDYKFAIVDASNAPRWESCQNRTLTVDTVSAQLMGAWEQPLAPTSEAAITDSTAGTEDAPAPLDTQHTPQVADSAAAITPMGSIAANGNGRAEANGNSIANVVKNTVNNIITRAEAATTKDRVEGADIVKGKAARGSQGRRQRPGAPHKKRG